MAYPFTHKLIFPLSDYKVDGADFGTDCTYDHVYWGIHLGEDASAPAETKVKAISRGRVVYSALHTGTPEKSNWGNIIIIAHKNPETSKIFFSLHAHLQNRLVEKGQSVKLGQVIGNIAKADTPENGMWPEEHLHFGIYTGEWKGEVLPGYLNENTKEITKLSDWKKPSEFIEKYNIKK